MFRVRSHREESLSNIHGSVAILGFILAFIGVGGLEGSMPFWLGASLVIAGSVLGGKFFVKWLKSCM